MSILKEYRLFLLGLLILLLIGFVEWWMIIYYPFADFSGDGWLTLTLEAFVTLYHTWEITLLIYSAFLLCWLIFRKPVPVIAKRNLYMLLGLSSSILIVMLAVWYLRW